MSLSLRFRVRAKDEFSPSKKTVILTGATVAESPSTVENQTHFVDGDAITNQIRINVDHASTKDFQMGKDVLVTFTQL